MSHSSYRTALIVGAGSGLSASIARAFAKADMTVALAARTTADLAPLAAETGAKLFACDATDRNQVTNLFAGVSESIGAPEAVVYNASYRVRGPFTELDPAEVEKALAVSAFGGFLLTGASASVKGYAQSAAFAMGKFALRGLAQSMARELAPRGIHVAHFVIDGGIRSARRTEPADTPDSLLDPDAIAASYLHVLQQPRSAWTWEIELRPWLEKF
jgi:NAD(P)-dependent dehydrogenase (short-subunit alcohol dehydrogenase family)